MFRTNQTVTPKLNGFFHRGRYEPITQVIITSFISGLKKAGVNFVVSLPSTATRALIPAIMDDPHFTHVPVANENDGMGICAGAWHGGKKPAFVLEATGILLGNLGLFMSITRHGGAMLLVVDHRGDFGDGAADFYFNFAAKAEQILESLDVPYTIVRKSNELLPELVRAQRTAEGFARPAAVLLSLEGLWIQK